MAKKATKAKAKATTTKAEPRSGTIQAIANKSILAGKTTEQVIDAVKEKFPKSRISASSVGWYRGKLKEEGHKLKEQPRGPKKSSEKPKGKKKASDKGDGGF